MARKLTPQEALANLLDYVSHDEAKDYETYERKHRKNHIYNSIRVLKKHCDAFFADVKRISARRTSLQNRSRKSARYGK